jgi:hypothetical protein
MYCDLCNKTVSSSEIVRIPLREMQRAVREGFNPFQTPGINTVGLIGLTELFGISSNQTFQHWRAKVMADTTDWGLCLACAGAFRKTTRGDSIGDARLAISKLASKFVREKNGAWNHQDWLNFLNTVRNAGHRSLPDNEIGLILEQEKVRFYKKEN